MRMNWKGFIHENGIRQLGSLAHNFAKSLSAIIFIFLVNNKGSRNLEMCGARRAHIRTEEVSSCVNFQ